MFHMTSLRKEEQTPGGEERSRYKEKNEENGKASNVCQSFRFINLSKIKYSVTKVNK
ncbi:unnamed protein product [Ixodes pacificus]